MMEGKGGGAMVRVRVKKLVVAFAATTQAMKMEACAKAAGTPGRIIPLPPVIDAGCGLSWCAPPEARAEIAQLLQREEIQAEGLYELLL